MRKEKDKIMACVGRFHNDNRRESQCKECARCQRHLSYLYDGAPCPEYITPSQCDACGASK